MVYIALLPKIPHRHLDFPDQKVLFRPSHGSQKNARVESKSKLHSAGDSLDVRKRRGKEKDQTSKSSNSENREEVSSEVTDTGSDHLRGSDLVGEFGDSIFHHVQLRGFSSDECRG
jgi:hypothetical protein